MPISVSVELDTSPLDRQLDDLASRSQASGKKIGEGIASGATRGEAATARLTESLDTAGDSFGAVGSGAGKLAGALDMLVPGAGGAARAVADLADVGEVATGAAGALGMSLGTLLSVALPIAAVVAGVALAWSEYSAAAEEATEFQERLNAALDGVDGIISSTKSEINKLKLNMGQLTEAQYEDTEIRRKWADQLASGTEKLRAEKTALEDQMAAIGTANTEYLKLQDRLHEVNGLLDTATTLNKQGEAAALANAEFSRERAESERVLSERLQAKSEQERRAAEATAQSTETTRKALEEARAYLEQLKASEAAEARRTGAVKKGVAGLRALTRAAEQSLMTEQERIITAGQAAEQEANSLARVALMSANTATERKQIETNLQVAVQTIRDETAAKLEAQQQKEVEDAQRVADQKIAAEERVDKARQDAIVGALGAAQGGLESIIALIGGPVAGAIAGLVLSLEDVVAGLKTQLLDLFTAVNQVNDIKKAAAEADTAYEEQISSLKEALSEAVNEGNDERAADIQAEIVALREEQEAAAKAADKQIAAAKEAGGLLERIPYVISDLVISFVDTFVPMFVKTLPDIAKNFALALTSPEFLASIAKIALYLISPWVQFAFWAKVGAQIFDGLWEAFMTGWRDFVSGQMFDDVKSAIVSGFEGAINSLREAWNDIIQGIRDVLSFKWAKGGGSVIGDLVTELVSLGTASTKTFGDAPSMQRAGPQGERVQTSPGDYYLVGRNPQALLEQALDGAFGNSSAPVAASGGGGTINLAWQHQAFDGFFVNHASLGGETTEFFRQMRARDARGM